MGRNRKSREEHVLNGTFNRHPEYKNFGSSALISYKDVTEIRTPDCLKLTRSRKAFQETTQKLLSINLLTPLDLPNLEIVFKAYESYLKADERLREFEKEMDLEESAAQSKYKILLKAQKQFFDEFVQLSSRYGMTPSDRAKLTIPEEQPKDALEEILNG